MMREIISWYQQYYADGFFLIITMVSYIYLFVYEKKVRKNFLYPVAALAFCILNPILYRIVFKHIIYWRLFWLIPETVIIAYALTRLVKECSWRFEKIAILTFAFLILLVKGTNVYSKGNFDVIQNFEKVSTPVKNVCDAMLEWEETPKCILPSTLFCEARQYSGNIQMAYGRNVQGFILGPVNDRQAAIYREMEAENPDYGYMLSCASGIEYNFVVTYEQKMIPEEILKQYGLREVGNVSGYRIYYRSN